MDIRKQQKQAILKMLALNEDDETSAEAPIDWKVLILDEPCRELLAPLVSVNELRARGVTLHAPIESPRDALGDVAAVYLCRPSASNAAIIARDAAQALYGALHCNWSRRAERKVLEGFARELAAAPPREGLPAAEDLVRSVWDRHVDFVALEPRLFHLRLQRRLKEVCGAGLAAPERVLEEVAEEVAAGLFCACAAVGAAAPVVRARPGGCAARAAAKLHARLHDEWRRRGGAAAPAPPTGAARPLVVLLDRADDLAAPLRHAETYQALVDDVLDHRGGRATFVDNEASRTVDLRVDEDAFYAQHAARSFPDVIDASADALAQLRARENALRARGGGEADGLAETVGELPRLLERKKRLELHTAVLGAVMKQVVAREVPRYAEAEEPRAAAADVEGLLGEGAKGTVDDKLRLLGVAGLQGGLDDDAFAALAAAAGCAEGPDRARLARGVAAIGEARKLAAAAPAPVAEAADDEGLASVLAKAQAGAKTVAAAAASKVGSLLSRASALQAVRAVGNLFEARPGTEHDTWLELDAKVGPAAYATDAAPPKLPAAETPLDAIVFHVGAGSYLEHHALQRAFAEGPRTVCYGAADLADPTAFLEEIMELGA